MKALPVLLLVSPAILLSGATTSGPIAYPQGYKTWTHIKSALNDPGHAGFGRYAGLYHIYANDRALQGYRTGRFPDGSAIVYEMHETRTAGHVVQPLRKRFIDVMVKDARRYPETGGWGYEEFLADGKDTRIVSTERSEMKCHACHVTQQDRDYIYSRYSE